ncbi:MAG: MerR family transcriptional regulator [Deltaproteobacteria bacterium]|nr:MerR family transcriptional regulator [Deltaproteobacteria bacterium]
MEWEPKQVEKITGIPTRRIQFYVENGLVSVEAKYPGRGVKRLYSKDNILELLVIKELANCGIELNLIRLILAECRKKNPEMLKVQTYEVKHPPEFYIEIFDGGSLVGFSSFLPFTMKTEIHSGKINIPNLNRGRGTKGKSEPIVFKVKGRDRKEGTLVLDMSQASSAIVLNMSRIYGQIAHL